MHNTVKCVFCPFCKKCPLLNSLSGCGSWHHQAAGTAIDSWLKCKEEIYFHYFANWGIPKECLGRGTKSETQAPLNSVHVTGLLACYSCRLIKNYSQLQGHLNNVQSSSPGFCFLTHPALSMLQWGGPQKSPHHNLNFSSPLWATPPLCVGE